MRSKSQPQPEPAADPAPAAPPVGVLTALADFKPTTATLAQSASLGRSTLTVLAQARQHFTEGLNSLLEVSRDATAAQAPDDSEFITNVIARLS
jgi:hypothetical protein